MQTVMVGSERAYRDRRAGIVTYLKMFESRISPTPKRSYAELIAVAGTPQAVSAKRLWLATAVNVVITGVAFWIMAGVGYFNGWLQPGVMELLS
jgi:hypothetical protein